MKFEIEKDDFINEFTDMISGLNIHGHINHKDKNQRKPTVSVIGKEVAREISESLWAYLTAFEVTK